MFSAMTTYICESSRDKLPCTFMPMRYAFSVWDMLFWRLKFVRCAEMKIYYCLIGKNLVVYFSKILWSYQICDQSKIKGVCGIYFYMSGRIWNTIQLWTTCASPLTSANPWNFFLLDNKDITMSRLHRFCKKWSAFIFQQYMPMQPLTIPPPTRTLWK